MLAETDAHAVVQVLRDMLGWPDVQANAGSIDADASSTRDVHGCTLRAGKEELISQLLALQIVSSLPPQPPLFSYQHPDACSCALH